MKKQKILALSLALCCTAALFGCGNTGSTDNGEKAESSDNDRIYQVALLQSLTQGYYDGIISADELKKHGDTGIGTFEGVNGEMIVLDGKVYRADDTGKTSEVDSSETIPFSNVTFFEADGSLDLKDISDIEGLKEELGKKVEENGRNNFYMVKVNGTFPTLKVRSEPKQEKPWQALDKALEETQVEFDHEDIKGTLVGLYTPDYMGGLNSVGWHFHFISEDKSCGGHVLQLSISEAKAEYDVTPEFEMKLAEDPAFQEMNLAKNVDEAIKNAEQKSYD